MIYQILLYDGNWEKKISEKTVGNLLKQWFPRSRIELRQGLATYAIEFQTPEEGVLVSAEFITVGDSELVADKLYRCLYSLCPEYESMVEVNVFNERR